MNATGSLRIVLLLVLTGWHLAERSEGSGLLRNFSGARAAGLGGAMVAGAESPLGAMWSNPAALVRMDDPVLELGYFGAAAEASFENAVNGEVGLRRGDGHAGELAMALPFAGGRGTWGLSLIPEATLFADWRYLDAPGGLDGTVSYGRQRHRSRFIAGRAALGAGWEVNEWLSVGGSVGLVYERIDLEVPYIFQTAPGLAGFKTLLDLETDGLGWNGEAGILVRLHEDLRLGVRYRSATPVDSEGDATGEAGAQLAALGLAPPRTDFRYDATVSLSLPDILSAGLQWQAAEMLTVLVEVDWIPWSDHLDLMRVELANGNNPDLGADDVVDRVPLGWKDRFTFRAGVEYEVTPHWSLRGGYVYSPSAIPAANVTPLNAAIAEHTLSAGVGYGSGDWTVEAGYQLDLRHAEAVGTSVYQAGEYSRSEVELMTHWWGVSTRVRF